MALKLEERQFLGEASYTSSEIAAKVDRTSTLNLALEGVSSPAHTRHSGQLTIDAEETVALDTTAAETREKLSIPMSAGQNHQDELLVDNCSENNQHTDDLNPNSAIDIPVQTEKLKQLPLIIQTYQKLELGKHLISLGFTSIFGLLFSQKFEENKASSPQYLIIAGIMVACAIIWNGISFGAIYRCLGNVLQLFGITLVLSLLALLVGTFLPYGGFSFVCWLSAVLYLLPFLYLIIKPTPQPYFERFQD